MKPRQATIGMAQRAQGRRNPLNRGQMRLWRAAPCIRQGRRGPCEQRKDIEQFFGVARGQAALCVNLRVTFPCQRLDRGIGQIPLAPPTTDPRRSALSAPQTAPVPVPQRASVWTKTAFAGPESDKRLRCQARFHRAMQYK